MESNNKKINLVWFRGYKWVIDKLKINEKINEENDYCKRVILPNDNELKEHQLFLNKFLKKNFF